MGSLSGLTKQECAFGLCQGGVKIWLDVRVPKKIRMLCIGDQGGELSIPNPDP